MPYINIREYDQTITGPKGLPNNNIVAVPINASDGPSDRWITVYPYDNFVQIFGPNPDPLSPFGNSWEFAANLLLRGMPVCVRRITNFLDDDGENTPELLPDVAVARAIMKIRDIVGTNTAVGNLVETEIPISDSLGKSQLNQSTKGNPDANKLYNGVFATPEDLYGDPTLVDIIANDPNELWSHFVDVQITNTEWNYCAPYNNPHYKNDFPTWEDLITANPTGVTKDFYIFDNKLSKYSSVPIPNINRIMTQKVYPDDLRNESGTLTDKFADVIYNTNIPAVQDSKVWIYQAGAATVVPNHLYMPGPNDVSGNLVYQNDTDLPATALANAFAFVNSTETIWKFNSSSWINTGFAYSYSGFETEYEIDWVSTTSAPNTGIYRHAYNWTVLGDDPVVEGTDYFIKLYWQDTKTVNSPGNPIGTRPHIVYPDINIDINKIKLSSSPTISSTLIKPYINDGIDIFITEDVSETRLVSGTFGFTNVSLAPINIYSLRLTQKNDNGPQTTIYDAKLESIVDNSGIITVDPLLRFKNVHNEYFNDPIPMYDSTSDRWYIEIPAGCTVTYNRNLTNIEFELEVAGFGEFNMVFATLASANGRYEISMSSIGLMDVIKYALPPYVDGNEDIDNLPVIDGHGNYNLFTIDYLFPGTNGNFLNANIRTIAGQGMYVYVYRGKEYLERIELCSFRYRKSNGQIGMLDLDYNKSDIWKIILLKFGIMLPYNGYTIPRSVYGNYVKLDINPNITDYETLDYVSSLFAQSGKQIAKLQGGYNPSDNHIIHEVPKCYEPLKDKYKYDIKFISNGGYVDKITYPQDIISPIKLERRFIEEAQISVATERKDCVAYIDIPFDLTIDDVPQYFEHLSTSYAAAYDPWCFISLNTATIKWMPPSFVQLYTHAKSIQNGNKMYLPPAGVRRASVPEILKTNHELSSRYITDWQNNDSVQFINPIIWINGYDYSVYGQKTLYNIVNQSDRYESALQNLNVRLVANEVKKLIFKTCIELTFELNNMMTWNEFKSKLEPTLSVMQGEGVLTRYEVIMGKETMTKADLNSGHVVGTVRLAIASAAIDWDINLEIAPNEVTIYEQDYNSQYGG